MHKAFPALHESGQLHWLEIFGGFAAMRVISPTAFGIHAALREAHRFRADNRPTARPPARPTAWAGPIWALMGTIWALMGP